MDYENIVPLKNVDNQLYWMYFNTMYLVRGMFPVRWTIYVVAAIHSVVEIMYAIHVLTYRTIMSVEYMAMFFGVLHGVVTQVGSLLRRVQMQDFIDNLHENLRDLGDLDEKASKQVRNIVILSTANVAASFICGFVSALFFMPGVFGRETIFYACLLRDKYIPEMYRDHVSRFYYLTYFHLAAFMVASIVVFLYVILNVVFQTIRATQLLRYINHEFKDRDYNDLYYDEEYQEVINKRLIFIIKYHIWLKRAAAKFNEIAYFPLITYPMTGMFMGVAIVYYFCTASSELLHDSFPRLMIMSANVILHLTASTYTGQLLIDTSEEMFEAAVNCPWYCWNKKNRKTLLVLLDNAKNPPVLKALSVQVDVKLVISLIRSGYSLATAISQLSDRQSI